MCILIGELKKELYIEGVYKLPVKNIVDYEKTLTVEEALAQSKADFDRAKKMKDKLAKKKQNQNGINKKNIKAMAKTKGLPEKIEEDDEQIFINNQILSFGNKPIKKE